MKLVYALCAMAFACGGRTSPATQPTPKAFDPAKSDAEAVAAVDRMSTTIGGVAAWEKLKQLRWDQKYVFDGEMQGWFRHAWDRWNGRHRFEEINLASVKSAEAEGRPEDIQATVAMYDLFDHDGKGYAQFDGNALDRASRDKVVAKAYDAWRSDIYRLTAIHKLKDPGVVLSLEPKRQPMDGRCQPSCTVVKVTFVPEVGSDTWYVSINDQSNMPEILEKDVEAGKLGFGLEDWTEAGGLKFPGKFVNLGLNEVFRIENLQAGDPDDSLYIPQVR